MKTLLCICVAAVMMFFNGSDVAMAAKAGMGEEPPQNTCKTTTGTLSSITYDASGEASSYTVNPSNGAEQTITVTAPGTATTTSIASGLGKTVDSKWEKDSSGQNTVKAHKGITVHA